MSLIYLQIVFIAAASQYNEWFTGGVMPPDQSQLNMICGYYNQSIWLIANYMLEFQLTDEQFIDQSDLIPNSTVTGTNINKTDSWRPWGYGQYWTQIEHTLYYIYTHGETDDDWILSYNLQEKQFYEVYPIRPAVGLYSCLASFEQYLFVIGGTGSNAFHVLDISSLNWRPGSNMNKKRSYHSCIVASNYSNNYLYAISGDGIGTIEKINVNGAANGDIESFQRNKWIYSHNNLPIGYSRTRAVVHCNNILIIGGQNPQRFNKQMYVLDTRYDTISIGTNLSYQVSGTAVITVNHILYAFDGKTDGKSSVGKWQYMTLPLCTYASISPSTVPSISPSTAPYTSRSIVPTARNVQQQKAVATLYNYILLCIIAIFVMMAFVGLVDSKAHRNDVFRVAFIISFAVYSIDFISDIFFALNVYVEGSMIIFIASLVFILIPVILSLYQLYKGIRLWIIDNETSSFVSVYMDNHTKLIYIISLFCGSGFATISLLNSGLLRMRLFDMGLKKQQITAFQNQRLYTVVLIENIPQMILQIISIILSNGTFSTITLMALIFSSFSIILSIFEYLTKKSVMESQFGLSNVYLIAFDVVSDSILRKRSSFRYQRKHINRGIAEILKVDLIFVEQLRSLNVTGGLALYFRVKIHKEMEIENIMNEAIVNGKIGELIRNCWKIKNVPIIKELSISKIESNRTQHGQTNTNSNIALTQIDSNSQLQYR